MAAWSWILSFGKKYFPRPWGGTNGQVIPGMEHGPNGALFPSVSQEQALRISAVMACVHMRSETIGNLPILIRDSDRNIVTQSDIGGLLQDGPNSFMTKNEYDGMSIAVTDLEGNHVSVIQRLARTGRAIAINPVPTDQDWQFRQNLDTGKPEYLINGIGYSADDVLHHRGFSMDGVMGVSRLASGRHILASQIEGDVATMRAFKQGLKVGGFFTTPQGTKADDEQFKAFQRRMAAFSDNENMNRWMPLPAGFTPVTTGNFKISPVDAQLLNSRYFGIEEICRLFGVPPVMIGHGDKASSWASTTEQMNLFFLMYSLWPTIRRREATFANKLMTPAERTKFNIRYNIKDLQRLDTSTRTAMYNGGLVNGYYCQNEIREMEDMPGIGPQGDIFRVQLNTGPANVDDGGTQPVDATKPT